MCGIVGVAALGGRPLPAASDKLLDAMTQAVSHRGPEGSVTVREGPLGLGFTRLSLVAPDSVDQPLRTPDGTVVLVANGEVYNHVELARGLAPRRVMATRSDCEVLGHLYQEHGREFLRDVNGMFAVALYDSARRRLVFARDRFGIKPLYFHRNAKRIVFSSEIKALFLDPATPRQVDWDASLASPLLQAALVLNEFTPTSWFAGIEFVEPGTVVEIDLDTGATSVHRYWEFPGPMPEPFGSVEDYVHRYRELLAQAVHDCADSDAEVGLLLSGGIDSSAVAALAADVRPIHTFSMLSQTTVESGDAYSASLVAAKLGLPNHQVLLPIDHCPTVDEWLRFLWLTEHPMAGPEAYLKHELHRYARAVRPRLKGMLLGAASDEFNGGYSTVTAGGGDWTDFYDNIELLLRRGDSMARPDHSVWNDALAAPVVRTVGPSRDARLLDPYLRYLHREYRQVCQYNVWHEDRSAAGSGIEARVPFLDHRLVELSVSIPPERRQELLWDKRILRRAVQDLLPLEIVDREKVPFTEGKGAYYAKQMVVRLLAQGGGELVEQALAVPAANEYLYTDVVRELFHDARDHGRLDNIELLLRLVNLGLLDAMVADLPPALINTPSAPVLSGRVDVDFDDSSGAQLLHEMAGRDDEPVDVVPRWQDDILVLQAVDGSGTLFILRDGSIEYFVDADAPGWLAIVGQIDGRRSLARLMSDCGVQFPDIAEPLHEATSAGILVLDAVPVADDGGEVRPTAVAAGVG